MIKGIPYFCVDSHIIDKLSFTNQAAFFAMLQATSIHLHGEM